LAFLRQVDDVRTALRKDFMTGFLIKRAAAVDARDGLFLCLG
jgi:hypothetical protein